ncbi:MAG: hypothetical protein ABEI97_01700 [Candidatus Nanohaloarchaea archaeon]
MDSGVTYYAIGEKYVEEARQSAESLKEHNDIPTTLFTDQEVETGVIDNVRHIDASEYPLLDYIERLKESPYDRTLFLDTDTYVTANIEELFEMLDTFDIGLSIDELRHRKYAPYYMGFQNRRTRIFPRVQFRCDGVPQH